MATKKNTIMSETEKVYCMDSGCNSATMAALLNNQNNPALTALMSNGGMNNWMNNPWIYFVFLAMFGGGNMFGRNDNNQISALSNMVSDNHNNDLALQAINGNRDALGQLAQTFNCDISQIQTAICGVKSAIEQVGGAVGYTSESVKNAIAMGDASIVSKMQECCCANKMLVQQMGYEGQLRDQANTSSIIGRIDQLANGVQQGFSQIGFNQQQNTAAIMANQDRNTQRILDQMCANTTQDLRDKLAQASQNAQTSYLISQLKTTA